LVSGIIVILYLTQDNLLATASSESRVQLFKAGVAEALGEADEARRMRPAFCRDGIDRFERHHIWFCVKNRAIC
jgi:hypothetical protein